MPVPALSGPPLKDALGAALAQIPSGLFILTLRQGARRTGLLLSWVQQCAFAPPSVTFCLKEERWQLGWLREGAAATLHVLAEEKGKALVKRFGPGFGPDDDPFRDLAIDEPPHQAPRLREALAWLELKPTAFTPAGDHVVVVAQTLAGALQDTAPPWVHLRKNGLGY